MRDMGIAKGTAMFLCQIYECCIFKHFLTGRLAVLRRGEGRQRPHKVNLNCWLSTIAMILVVFVPRLYGEPKHTEPVDGKRMVSSQVTTSMNTLVRQAAAMQPKPNPTLAKMLNESTGVKIPPSLRQEHPAGSRERNPLSVHGKKTEALLHPIILRAANRHQIDPALVKAIIMAESSYNPKAISKRGAKGLMQLMPQTAEILGVKDSFNPEQNINAGVRHFKGLMNRFKGDVKLALAAYNVGSIKVRKYQGVPPFKATQSYIKKVLEYYQYFKEKMTS
jgi:hypothetical protein